MNSVNEDASVTIATQNNDLDGVDLDFSSLEQRTINPDRYLYVELVRSNLGERAAKIIDSLIGLGRLSVRELASKIPELNIKAIKSTLVSLIQLRCVKYFEEPLLSGKTMMYYYYNEEGILIMLYSGLIAQEIETILPTSEEYDHSASQIIQNILSMGSITLRDYLESNSDLDKHYITHLFVRLCETGFLVPISKLHYTPTKDLWNELYNIQYKLIPRNSTLSDLKKRAEAKSRAKDEFLKLYNSLNDLSKFVKIDQSTSLKTVVETVPLTFSLDRFLKSRRSKQLVQFAKSRIGSMSAAVYKIALKMTEQKTPYLIHPLLKTGLMEDFDESEGIKEDIELMEEKTPGVSFNAIDLAKHLPAALDLRGSLTTKKKSNKRTSANGQNKPMKKKLKTEDGFAIPALPKHITEDNEKMENDADEDELEIDDIIDDDVEEPHSIFLINCHLRLLTTSSTPFLSETRPGVFHIPYTKLLPVLRSSMYDYLIAATLGPSAMRIRRCIKANGLVSEKVINSTALMREKDIRSTIAKLIKYNVVEVQEVPRTVDRAAARAVFLFRIRESHSYNYMKQNLEWNMANLIFKKEKLKEENSTLLFKANRDDVKGRENELLLPSELNQLKMVRDRELNAFSRISRLLSIWEVYKFI